MGKCVASATVLTVFLAGVAPGVAQQMTAAPTTTMAGGGSSSRPIGNFFGGFTPTKIVNKPIDISGAARPGNSQSAMMPQKQSTKVFNVSSAFSKIQMPLFRSTAPSVPIVKPGPSNPLQPTAFPKVKPAPQPTQSKVAGFPPWL